MSVKIEHTDPKATSEVEEESVDVWISRGWKVVKEDKDAEPKQSEGDKLLVAKAKADQEANDLMADQPGSERKKSDKSG